jgi:SH3-like domain-containing protein
MNTFKALVFAGLAAMSSSALVAPAAAQVVEGEEHCVINVKTSDVLNVRELPSASGKIITKLRYGNCGVLVVGSCQGSWCPVDHGHYEGWVHSRYISMVSPAMYCVSGVAAGDVLNLRAYPAVSSLILTKLPRNQCDISFLPYATTNWQKVRVGGLEGWASRRFLSGQ